MQETVLNALPRNEKPKKTRDSGFIPGVLNGGGVQSTPVKFEASALNKVIARHGSSAKVWVKSDTGKKFGIIKEVQKHPVEGNVIHVEIQLVSLDHQIKMEVPLTFHGRDELEHRGLLLQVMKSEVEIFGKPDLMPEVIVVNVTGKEQGDSITVRDFALDANLEVQDREDVVFANITAPKEQHEEEDEAVPVETETATA